MGQLRPWCCMLGRSNECRKITSLRLRVCHETCQRKGAYARERPGYETICSTIGSRRETPLALCFQACLESYDCPLGPPQYCTVPVALSGWPRQSYAAPILKKESRARSSVSSDVSVGASCAVTGASIFSKSLPNSDAGPDRHQCLFWSCPSGVRGSPRVVPLQSSHPFKRTFKSRLQACNCAQL